MNLVRTLGNSRQLALQTLDELLFPLPGLLDFLSVLTIDSTPTIHPGKRILEIKREEIGP